MMNSTNITNTTLQNSQLPVQKMELAARNVDKSLAMDNNAPRLIDFMNVTAQSGSTNSGLTDFDYPTINGLPLALNNMTQIRNVSNVPLPPEIIDHFSHVQCHCMMGLFPEINRAWLTVDSDIYIWTYEENTDLAYFDGINETILCVGLVKPKPGVFHAFIKYLLVLTTAVDIIVLGVTFTAGALNISDEIQLIPDPVFTLPTDGNTITTITATQSGRLFLGSKEGSLFEISYQAASGWFGKRCKMVNLSTSALSFLVPSFLNAALSEEDGIIQVAIDDSRNILYSLTEKGSIEVCDLGENGSSFSRVTKVSQNALVSQAVSTVKTIDSQNFRPIISISPIEASESGNINLVAVTQSGMRFYLSVVGLSNQQPNQRPYTLTLIHVRLPPGYSANVTVRPRAVHMSHYRDRNLVLISNVKDKDVLWCMSSDLFPFTQSLMEAHTSVNLDGNALALAEVRHDTPISSNMYEELPLIVRQHAEPPKKYVVLTSHSVQIFIKLRPVDLLRQILIDSRGRDTEPLKIFFAVLRESQACATSLILASLENDVNAEVADLATRAFFMFGGEPKMIPISQTVATFAGTNLITSTPAGPQYQPNLQQTFQSPQSPSYQSHSLQSQNFSQTMSPQATFDPTSTVNFSAKHNGLYLYLCRILRPIWNRRCADKVHIDGKTISNQSTITSAECMQILANLSALHNFLNLNTQLSNPGMPQQSTSMNVTRIKSTEHDAQLEERQSLDAVKTFVCHCCQILGLWRILCDHQFHSLVGALPENHQQILQSITFKELFLYRQDICSVLISTLVNSYLGDNASVDSISNRLMEVCPHLYKPEDAAYSKASELLKSTRTVQNVDEKEEMVLSALQLCKNIVPNINLPEVYKQFTALKAYKAVVELCAHFAKKIDPDKVAENFYGNEDNAADKEGFAYYQKRMEIYREVINMLEVLYNEQSDQPSAASFSLDYTDQKSILLNDTEPSRLGNVIREIVNDILDSDDEIMHIALYEWMISKQMTNDIIRINKSSLEQYLKKSSAQTSDNLPVMDLLWKFYESNNNHAAAAKILNNLATKSGSSITLKERLTYLARAIMCMRSDKVGYAPYLGVFLRDLEDKMEVAKVQDLILDDITNLRNETPSAGEAIAALNSGLYEISQLYENFAEPFQLLECQLAIIDCAGYTDSDNSLVKSIWQKIIANELRKSSGSGTDRMTQVMGKVKHLARQYVRSSNCFPLDYIVGELEMINARLRGDKGLVPNSLVSMMIPFDNIIEVYNNLITTATNLDFWQVEENEFHLAESTACLITSFLNTHDTFNSVDNFFLGEKLRHCVRIQLQLYCQIYTVNLTVIT
ncbi:nuclear pore complex protein Nup155 isoform X2 [Cylas formicarius]|uniref:nuclear pore complex protein Nup155 isoform X2 n=1 Tax=Cylas formicarius TaxID=197179 RepID=UPI002958A3BA|nr:nuclear pore complex protein Nup155 isoform X2 [Cylas formicarius]